MSDDDQVIHGGGIPGFDADRELAVDELGYLIGIRQWRIFDWWRHDGDNVLRSASRSHKWAPLINTAQCLTEGSRTCDHSPNHNHRRGCGFWAYTNPDEKWSDSALTRFSDVYVEGVIAGWGIVIPGEKGFRCQHAMILAIVGIAEAGPLRNHPHPHRRGDRLLTAGIFDRRSLAAIQEDRRLAYGIQQAVIAEYAAAGHRLDVFLDRESMLAAYPLSQLDTHQDQA